MAGRDLKELFRAFRNADELAFRRAANTIIEEEEARHHVALARDLRKLLASGESIDIGQGDVRLVPPPTDPDQGWDLATVRRPERYLANLVLRPAVVTALTDLAKEVPDWNRLEALGVPRRNRVIFYGPPGCGKTSAAEALAAELGVPLVVVRLDAIVSSYLGQTAGNLRRIFDYTSSAQWVVLFDEFDALGRERNDPSEHGEIKRVVNSFLQLLDGYTGPAMLIAATNHEEILDRALWRRFDEVVEFPLPTVREIRMLLGRGLKHVKSGPLPIDEMGTQLRGLPHAAVEATAWTAIRIAMRDNRTAVSVDDLTEAVAATKRRRW
ncbi:AAA family ATPase [Candidatus Poriferisodalis sp.]|uniref:AAA family ATPase n=1 Tax=Candidatus Poriferisodalis sp. TaxID=3101277 RepID=UPI003B521DE5